MSLVAASNEIIQLWRKLKTDKVCCLSYDTTYLLGKFYVSVLIGKIDGFVEEPSIPLGFLIHDLRDTRSHCYFFHAMLDNISELNSDFTVIVTDREPGIRRAIKKNCPKVKNFFCWNHFKSDLKVETSKPKHNLKNELKNFVPNINKLLQTDTENFEQTYNEISMTWTASFKKYFEKNIKEDVKSSSRYMIEQFFGKPHPNGLTTNRSESLNSVLKRFTENTMLPPDVMVLSLYGLVNSYITEIYRGVQF